MRRKMSKIKELMNNNFFFNFIGKKNNQTSVSDADREITTVGPTEKMGKPRFRHYRFTLELRFLDLHRRL